MDSDDWVHPMYLEALYEAAQGYGIAVCYRSKTDTEELPLSFSYSIEYLKPEDYYLKYMGNSIVAWAKLYHKELFRDIRYPIGKLHEDELVTYKLLFQPPVIPFISKQLYAHYINPKGIMLRPWSPQRLDALDAFENQLNFFTLKGYLVLAENRFFALVKANRQGQKMLHNCKEISETDRHKKLHQLRRQLKRTLFRYRKYNWVSIWNRGDDLWLYSDTFSGLHIIHMIWRKIKSFWHSWISK